jgi:hypothetical protein
MTQKYNDDVLAKDKSLTYASLKWLKEAEAITDEDVETFTKVKEYRNLLAHEIARMLTDGLPQDFAGRFNAMIALLDKIEKWWIVNFDIPVNPELTEPIDEIDIEEIVPGPIAGLKMMIDVALGSDETAHYYINALRKDLHGG